MIFSTKTKFYYRNEKTNVESADTKPHLKELVENILVMERRTKVANYDSFHNEGTDMTQYYVTCVIGGWVCF